ncbi:hypothetical protein NFI96_028649 [Prochilodus magdalenae]|nr:hypothetical protein NFI96_028649 [Prochilodus magdalenae]
MKSCSSALCVLILLITTFTPGGTRGVITEPETLFTVGTSEGVVTTRNPQETINDDLSEGSELCSSSVKVRVKETATLPCSERCPGVVRWTMSRNPTEVLAECDQTSCRSVKEGYQMIHDQYLKGDLSLTITDADLSKRGWYTCKCDDRAIRDVDLQVGDGAALPEWITVLAVIGVVVVGLVVLVQAWAKIRCL